MREIKFRAWDEQNKIMHNEVEFIRSGTEGNDWILFKSDKQKLECENVLNNPYFQQQINIMQYTGLKDKNEIEIYEGDIVYLSGIGLTEIEFPFIDLYQACYENDIGAIIGNIYENPELLEFNK